VHWGGFLIEHYGSRTGFIIDAGTYFVSSVFVFSIRMSQQFKINKSGFINKGKEIVGKMRKSIWEEMGEGFLYLFKHKEIRFILNMIFILFAAAGAIYIIIIVFIQQSFASVTKDLGILAVFLGVGLFSGALLYGKWGKKVAWYKTIFFCLITGGIMLIIFAVLVYQYSHLLMAMILSFALGLIIGPIFIAANTIIHVICNDAMRGKVFSALEIVIHFAFLISMLFSSWLTGFIAPVWILTAVGALFAAVGIIGAVRIKFSPDLALLHK